MAARACGCGGLLNWWTLDRIEVDIHNAYIACMDKQFHLGESVGGRADIDGFVELDPQGGLIDASGIEQDGRLGLFTIGRIGSMCIGRPLVTYGFVSGEHLGGGGGGGTRELGKHPGHLLLCSRRLNADARLGLGCGCAFDGSPVELVAGDTREACGGDTRWLYLELGRLPNILLVSTLPTLASPAGGTLVARRPTRRDGARHSDVGELM